MPENPVENIFNELSATEGLEKNKVLSLIRTRVAGGLEFLHRGHESSKYWMALNTDIETLTNTDPQEAFKFALEILQLDPTKPDPEQYRSWLEGNALIILSTPKVKPLLLKELNTDNSFIRNSLESFLGYQVPENARTKEDLSDYPQSFNLVMSLVILHDLHNENLPSIARLKDKSQKLLADPLVKHVIGLYHNISDDRELVDPLFQAIQNS